jgi:hypothetical protein
MEIDYESALLAITYPGERTHDEISSRYDVPGRGIVFISAPGFGGTENKLDSTGAE